jgi:hypothetical protein
MPLGLSASILGSGGSSSGGVGTVLHNKLTKLQGSLTIPQQSATYARKQAAVFDGTSDIPISGIPAFGTGAVTYTLSASIPTANPATDMFLLCQYGTGIAPYDDVFVWINTLGNLRVNFRYSSTDHLIEVLDVVTNYSGRSIFISVTADGTNAKVYFNGTQVATSAITHNISGTTFRLGRDLAASGYYTGIITNVSIYNRALSAAEILIQATSGVPPVSGLICALDPNQEGYGRTWYDTSGADRDATLPTTGVTWLVPNGGPLRGYATSAPVSGTYAVGDIVYNSAPTAGGFIGWVCTAAPLTFKTWGAISA